MKNRLKIGIAQGDVNGIAYELIIKLLMENRICELCSPILYGSPKIAAYYRKALNIENFSLNAIRHSSEAGTKRANVIHCIDDQVKVEIGSETEESARMAMRALNYAIKDLDNGDIDALIVAPQGESSFMQEDAHSLLDFLNKHYKEPNAITILVKENLKVGLATEYLKLRDVPHHITMESLKKKIQIFNDSLKIDFTLSKPKIAVLGLNPFVNCTEQGEEEREIIAPAIEWARSNGIMAIGPFSADNFFNGRMYEKFDGVLAMYFDQGVLPFKSIDDNAGALYIAGIPSVVTASLNDLGLDIVGKGIADEQSLRNALYLAIDIFNNRTQNLELKENPLPHYDIFVNTNESDLNVEQIEGVKDQPED